MKSLKEQFTELKRKEQWKDLPIENKLEEFIYLYEGVQPLLKGMDLSILLERKFLSLFRNDKKNQKGDDRSAIKLLSKIIKRKLSSKEISKTLSLSAAELLVIASITSKDKSLKKLYHNKALMIMTIGMKNEELQLSEALKIVVPERFEGEEFAQIIVDKLNNIQSQQTEDQQYRSLDELYAKITDAIEDPKTETTQMELDILVHFQLQVSSKLHHIEGRPTKL